MKKSLCLCASVLLASAASAQTREGEPNMLEPSIIVAEQPLVRTVSDTVVFSPGAINVEDDAMLGDILQKIPGIEVTGGTITLYGRKIDKLLIGGRLYFGGDILTGLRNIQGDAVESILAYERPSDFTRLSGVDDGEAEPVLDIRIKRRFMENWKGRVQAGANLPHRYQASGNAGTITDTSHINILAGFRNIPSSPSMAATSLSKFGNGAEGDQDWREAGFDYSKDGKETDIDVHVKYNGKNYLQDRGGWSQTINSTNSTFSMSDSEISGRNDAVRAESNIEWRPSQGWTFIFKPYLNYNGTASRSDPESQSFQEDPRLDPDAAALNSVNNCTASFQRRYEGRLSLQASRRFAKKGRTASFRINGSVAGGKSHNFNDYLAVTHKNGRSVTRKQFIISPWQKDDISAQASWNEPVGKRFHLNVLANARIIRHSIDRDFHSMESMEGIENWGIAPSLRLSEQMASLPAGYADFFNPELSSDGTYTGVLMTLTASIRYVRKKFNLVAGVSAKPIWNDVRYSTTDRPDERITSRQFYASPNFSLRYNKSKTVFLSVVYKSNVSTPSPSLLIPLRNGTNPLIVRTGNPDLKSSFTHRLNLSYNYSDPVKGSSLVLEAAANMVQNAFATSTEYIPETGGRNVRTCNIDGNWSANASLVFNHSFKGTPVSISNHLDGLFTNDAAYLYNSSKKSDDKSIMQRMMARERIDVSIRWRRISVTAMGGAEYTRERSILHPEMAQSPYALFADLDAAWRLPRRWRISSDFGFYSSRGHGFSQLDRNLYMWNASVSKGLFKGKATVRLTAADILDQNTHLTYSFGASSRRFFEYEGFGRMILVQLYIAIPPA